VPLLQDSEVENQLVKQGVESSKARKAAQLAEGNMNLALRLIESEEDDNSSRFIEWMRACFKRSYTQLVGLSENYHALDKLSQKTLIAYSLNILRETLLTLSGANTMSRLQGEELKFVQDFSKVMSVEKIDQSFTLMNEASYHLERNGSPKMIFLDLSIKLSKIIHP
jgi:DNA polymerase-3 subunit delta'